LLPEGSEPLWRDPSGSIRLAEVNLAGAWIGERLKQLEADTGARVAFVTRLGKGVLPNLDLVIQDGDRVHLVMKESDVTTVEAVCAKGPEGRH
jgi:trk system potassium uptake protein TrkA